MDLGASGTASGAQMPALVTAEHVSKSYRATRALRDVTLEIRAGSTHALLGRNGAGKSTMVGVLTGVVSPDAGSVTFDGRPAPGPGDRAGWKARVACVYQRSTVVPSLTVAENLFLNRQAGNSGTIRWRQLMSSAARLLTEWEIPVLPQTLVGSLSVADRQMVEIARALSTGCRFIILDEPTAKLGGREIARLFSRMRVLQQAGVTFLYISHHLEEIYAICQDVTVLLDGQVAGQGKVADWPAGRIIAMMTGEGAAEGGPVTARSKAPGEQTALAVRALSSTRASEPFHDVNFEIRQGELVGLAGLVGSGKLGVAEVICGLAPGGEGEVTTTRGSYRATSVARAIRSGVSYVPQDRQAAGIVPAMSVAENITMAGLGMLGKGGFVWPARRDNAAAELVDRLDIKTASIGDPVSSLSGGNQQKVMLGRALHTAPDVLVLVAPTAGVDIASKRRLLDAVTAAADRGTAVLIVSDDVDDLRICQRIIVMFKGSVTSEILPGEGEARLIAAMEGFQDGD